MKNPSRSTSAPPRIRGRGKHLPHHKYFFPAATTRARNTGLAITVSTPQNGFITAFSHTSNTSAKNWRMASSVCGLVALFAIEVPPVTPAADEDEAWRSDEGGVEV